MANPVLSQKQATIAERLGQALGNTAAAHEAAVQVVAAVVDAVAEDADKVSLNNIKNGVDPSMRRGRAV